MADDLPLLALIVGDEIAGAKLETGRGGSGILLLSLSDQPLAFFPSQTVIRWQPTLDLFLPFEVRDAEPGGVACTVQRRVSPPKLLLGSLCSPDRIC
jgi:hypothetical protein